MANAKIKDMTVGSPMKLVLGFALPLLFGNLFQQFYNVVDSMIVGQVLGVDSLAAVGTTTPVNFLIIGFCMGLCNGFAIPVAQSFGAKEYDKMRKFVANCAWLTAAFGVLITIVVSLMCRQILIWMKVPGNIIDQSYIYILIIFLGIPATMLYNMLSGIIRAMGDSKTPLKFLMFSSVLNIVLDILFLVVLRTGVGGAAIATILSQLVSGLLCLGYTIRKYEILHLTKKEWKMENQLVKVLCAMGVPMGLQYTVTAIGNVVWQSSLNALGSQAVAASTAGLKVSLFMCCPYEALGTTLATYGGQNVGAKKLDRVGKGLRATSLIAMCYFAFSWVIVFLFGKYLVSLFMGGASAELVVQASGFLLILVTFHPLLAVVNTVRFLIQGMGFSTFAIFSGVAELIARVTVGLWVVPRYGFYSTAFASPFAWFLADLFLIPAYFYVKGKLRRRFEEEGEKEPMLSKKQC